MANSNDEGGDPLALSRLDVISCGLGGAVLLGIVFSVVRHKPPVEVSAPPFILIEWEVSNVVEESKVFPLINAVITTPSGVEFDLPLEDFDSAGRSKRPVERQEPNSAMYESGDYSILGFSRFGDDSPLLRSPSGALIANRNDSTTPTYQLHIANPVAGPWKIKARYQYNVNSRALGDQDIKNKIRITTRAYTRDNPTVAVAKDSQEEVPFGQTNSLGIDLVIPAYDR